MKAKRIEVFEFPGSTHCEVVNAEIKHLLLRGGKGDVEIVRKSITPIPPEHYFGEIEPMSEMVLRAIAIAKQLGDASAIYLHVPATQQKLIEDLVSRITLPGRRSRFRVISASVSVTSTTM